MSTLILHLSDIHFVKDLSGTAYDLDSDIRNELERDLERKMNELGRPRAIAITGDIAFAGKPEEYDTASRWISKIVDSSGCKDVMAIPGNHDVS